jgi:hypothetical protein
MLRRTPRSRSTVAGRNLRDAGRVSDRRNHAGELGDLDVVRDHLPLLQPVAEFGVE